MNLKYSKHFKELKLGKKLLSCVLENSLFNSNALEAIAISE